MTEPFSPLERFAIAICCFFALLLFFSPLLAFHVPIAGDQGVSGYDVASRVNQIRENLKAAAGQSPGGQPPNAPQGGHPRLPSMPSLPLSVEFSWLIPVAIAIAFLSAAVALIAISRGVRFARITCMVGAVSAAVAVLHLNLMNSDVHSWFLKSMQIQDAGSKNDPLAGWGRSLGNLILGGLQLKPGWGLYLLMSLLGVAAVFGFTRMLSQPSAAPISKV